MEAMWTYFLPPISKAKEWISEGKIGKIRNIKADFAFKAEYDPDDRLFNPALAGGALLDIGIYPIAFTWLVIDQFPENITVFPNMTDTGVDLEETMIFEYKDQVLANLTASFAYDPPNNAIISGTDGYIFIPDFFMAKECFLYRQGKLAEHFSDNRQAVGYNYEIEAVNRDLARGLKESEIVPLAVSLKLQELMEAVKRKFSK
jgi:predicted dehydrogenase